MNRLRRAPGIRPTIRPIFRVLAVLALIALISTRLLVHSGGATDLTNSEIAHLPTPYPSGKQPAPAKQGSASRCFNASSAVSSVRSDGDKLFVLFADEHHEMEIEFLANEDAAIRAANANPNENSYNNTIWLESPSGLGHADITTLANCIPSGPHHRRRQA